MLQLLYSIFYKVKLVIIDFSVEKVVMHHIDAFLKFLKSPSKKAKKRKKISTIVRVTI